MERDVPLWYQVKGHETAGTNWYKTYSPHSPWNRLPTGVVDPPSVEMLKTQPDAVLGNLL